jgi:hypothetical protein
MKQSTKLYLFSVAIAALSLVEAFGVDLPYSQIGLFLSAVFGVGAAYDDPRVKAFGKKEGP